MSILRKRIVGLLLVSAVVARPHVSDGYWCGQPSGSGATPVASDTLYILNTAVGNDSAPCPLCVCDVTGDGFIFATDGLKVLRAAVGLPETLSCPNSATDECKTCDVATVKSTLQGLTSGARVTANKSVVFACSSGQLPLQLTDGNWGDQTGAPGAGVSIMANDVKIVGGYVFELSPRCDRRCISTCTVGGNDCTRANECAAGQCSGLTVADECAVNADCASGRCSTTICPDIDARAARFLNLRGQKILVEGITVRGFFEGISMRGKENIVRNVTLDRTCDDAISNPEVDDGPDDILGTGDDIQGGVGNLVEGGTISRGCDKCVDACTGPALVPSECPTGTQVPLCYHLTVKDVKFRGCRVPVRLAPTPSGGGSTNGSFLVSGGTTRPLRSVTAADDYPCDGFDFDAGLMNVAVQNHTVERCISGQDSPCEATATHSDRSCTAGFDLAGTQSLYKMKDNRIYDAIQRGIIIRGGRADLLRNAIKDTGGAVTGGGSPPRGGGTATNLGDLRLGNSDTAATGNNKVCDNVNASGARRELAMHDRTGPYTLPADRNFWGLAGLITSGSNSEIGVTCTGGSCPSAPTVDASTQLGTDPISSGTRTCSD